MRALPTGHITHQLQVPNSLGIDHHSPFDRDIANEERRASEAGVQTRFRVFEEGARSGESVVSER